MTARPSSGHASASTGRSSNLDYCGCLLALVPGAPQGIEVVDVFFLLQKSHAQAPRLGPLSRNLEHLGGAPGNRPEELRDRAFERQQVIPAVASIPLPAAFGGTLPGGGVSGCFTPVLFWPGSAGLRQAKGWPIRPRVPRFEARGSWRESSHRKGSRGSRRRCRHRWPGPLRPG